MKVLAKQKIEIDKVVDFGKDVFSVLSGGANDLEWFMFENKIREIIHEIIAPINR